VPSVKKILIANRGEIAVRIIRACRDMGVSPVAVYSECDRTALHVRYADEAYPIGPSAPRESYLRGETLIAVARRSGAEAVHPGYGFLAENARFAEAVRDAGLTFIGPSPDAIETMGSKTAARAAARRAGVPVVPGSEHRIGSTVSDREIADQAGRIGYPLLVKAVAGGGGKGMRTVTDAAELTSAVRAARSEAGTAFGDTDVYLERRLNRARHIEIQILGDNFGAVVPFVERECSIQRRHQKVVEETPSVAITPALRQTMTSAAAAVARAVNYTNAGTIEFLLDEMGRFYFLEMNTRLQVEHPITEMVTGIDLVCWQIRIAGGEPLSIDPNAVLYAEDPDNNFLPSPGRIVQLRPPGGPGVRDDNGATAGLEVPLYYDPLISKLITWAEDRPQALARMRRAVGEYLVTGVKTTLPFFGWLLAQPEFVAGAFHTTYLDEALRARNGGPFFTAAPQIEDVAAIAAAIHMVLSPADRQTAAPTATGGGGGSDRWKLQARLDGLRVRHNEGRRPLAPRPRDS
jgi:acetyl-CoA carboxylase, biotin carboxylase subunit